MLNKTTVKAQIEKELAKTEETIVFVRACLKVAEEFVGKKITRRIFTAIKENPLLKDMTICYNDEHGQFHIRMWSKLRDFEDRYGFFLGYHARKGYLNTPNSDILMREALERELNSLEQLLRTVNALQVSLMKVEKFMMAFEKTEKAVNEYNKMMEAHLLNYLMPIFEIKMSRNK